MAGLNPLAGVPRSNLPLDSSYHPSEDPELRLLKYEKPPFGWWGNVKFNQTDFSDCRYWHAPERMQQDHVWNALGPTLKEFSAYTGVILERDEMRCLELGYQASYDEIMLKLNTWAFDNLGFNHEWTRRGSLTKALFRLDRWYGTMQDYQYSPNWPTHRYSNPNGRGHLIQNPEVRACRQCVHRDIMCHGHRENPDLVCTPCIKNGKEKRCSKRNGGLTELSRES